MSSPCEILEWDSTFFGCRIARILPCEVAEFAVVDAWCKEQRVDCIYYLADPGNYAATSSAEAAGFRYLDIRLTLRHDLKGSTWQAPAEEDLPYALRTAELADLPFLEEVARSSYELTRFSRDPHFDPDKSRQLYALWIAKALREHGSEVFVAATSSHVIGFCAVSASPGAAGQIMLAGVAAGHRGQRIGTHLVSATIEWARTRGCTSIQVVTQGINIPAQRLYTSNGFYPLDVRMWLHKWYR